MNAQITTANNSKFGAIEYTYWSLMALAAIADMGIAYAVNLYVVNVIYLVPFAIQLTRFCSNHVLDSRIPNVEVAGRVIDVAMIAIGGLYALAVIVTLYNSLLDSYQVTGIASLTVGMQALRFWLIRSYWSRH